MSCKVARDGRLLRVTLARPEKRNAIDAALCRALVDAIEGATPEDTGAVLLDAEGPSFCSGMDLGNSLQTDAGELAALHERLFTLGRRALVPIVAHVQGHAIAGGTGLVANAHVAIADEDARFGLTELRVALWPFLIYRAVEEAIGARRTLGWTLTAGLVSAAEARDPPPAHSVEYFVMAGAAGIAYHSPRYAFRCVVAQSRRQSRLCTGGYVCAGCHEVTAKGCGKKTRAHRSPRRHAMAAALVFSRL